MNGIFKEKVAVVTGASRGIGRGIALELAEAGVDIAIIYRTEEDKAGEVASLISKMGRKVIAIKCDVSDDDDVVRMHDAVMKKFGKVNFLINNAGIHQHLKSWELGEEDWHRVMDVNVTGTFLVTKAFTPHMIEKKSGRIVNISSCVAFTGTDHEVHYAASKGAVFSLTKSLALELAQYGINVNAIAPGYIETDMVVFDGVHDRGTVLKTIPQHRLGQPIDIGRAVRFLCSEDSNYITGQVIHVNGGLIMY
ncbi:MAG: 3-oxoacyl-ACP reductase family protein [Thermoplasmata archaeon]|nr:3-oxoacyl-ACP reductase family protein [Thermoplasmata archaeon]